MPGEREPESFVTAISGSVQAIVDCLDGLSEEELNWRPPVAAGNSLYIVATHTMGNAEQNIVERLGGVSIGRVRDEEFAAAGDSPQPLQERWALLRERIQHHLAALPGDEWERERDHPSAGRATAREVLLNVHRHASEHLGEAQLIRDLLMARRG